MSLAGVGAGINELTALAGTSELAPTSKRGTYVGLMVLTILPWCPSVLYAQLIHQASSFRYVGLLCGVWAFIGLLMTVFFYFPPPRPNASGYSKMKILSRVDYTGGLLSISGTLLFMMGIEWGGYQVCFFDLQPKISPELIVYNSTNGAPSTSSFPSSWVWSS